MTDIAALGAATRSAWAAEVRATLALAWPLVLTNIAQTAMNTTDLIVIGHLSADALAAAALGTNLYFATLIFAIGIVTATAPMMARELGRNRHSVRDIRRTFRQGLWMSVAVSVPLWILLWQAEPILLLLGQERQLAHDAARYMHTLQWAILPVLFYVVARSLISALERPLPAMWAGLAAIVVNAVLCYGFVHGAFGLPRLELVGAGIATTLSNAALFAFMALYLVVDRKFRRYHFFGRFWRADWQRFREIWRLGLPIGVTLGFEVTIFNAAAFLMGLFGPNELAAFAIALQIAAMTFMVPLGLNQAATVRVGRAFGAGDHDGMTRAGWTAFGLGFVFMLMSAAMMLLIPETLVGAFLGAEGDRSDAVLALAVSYLAFAALFQVFDGGQVVGAGVLRGLHDTRVPMIYAAIGYWGVGLPVGVLLAFWAGLRGEGLWVGLAAGLAIVAGLMTFRWINRERLGLTRDRPGLSEAAH